MLRATLVAGIALGTVSAPAAAYAAVNQDSFQVRTTRELVELCGAPQSDPLYTAAQNFCHGFAVGVFRVLQEQDLANPSGRMFCMPDPTPSRAQGIAQFVQWAQADASHLALPPADGIALYLSNKYPCPATK